jgi:hypothetical protein
MVEDRVPMSNIIFLDIDGVLNGHEFSQEAQSSLIRPDCIKRFNRIIDAASPDIVLSSAWRYMIAGNSITLKGFEYMLRTHGVSNKIRIIDITVADEVVPTRGKQIEHWLKVKCQFQPDKYLVLDNDEFDIRECGHPLIQTNGKMGLQDDDVKLVLKYFER